MSERDYTVEFHAHLDKCERCGSNPMTPCALGGWLLTRAATQAVLKRADMQLEARDAE